MTSTPDRDTEPARRPRRRVLRRRVLVPAAVVLAVVVGALLPVFQPWRLVLDQQVDEAVPAASAEAAEAGAPAAAPPEPVVVASGELISHEHATTGSVQVLSLADGSRVLRLVDLDTSDGPALRVWLTDAPVLGGRDGWHVFDDGRYADLGELKGNLGSQNYPVPPEVDLAALTSLSIWCDRFDVSFGAAALTLG